MTYKPGHIRVAAVHIHKKHIVKFGLVVGVLFMAVDMFAAVGIARAIGENWAHVFGASGATLSGGAAAIDQLIEDLII